MIAVRPERATDAPSIYAVVAEAFGRPDEAELVDALRGTEAFVAELSLVAVDGRELVGHVLFPRARVGPAQVLALGPVAVRPDRQGRGIGSALVRTGLEAADAARVPVVVVLGDPGYYGRFGFVPAATLGIEPPVASWQPAFQAVPLTAWDGSPRGRATYPSAFGAEASGAGGR